MPATPTTRRAATAIAAAAVAVFASLAVAAPARADGEVKVSLQGLASSMTAGGRGDGFSVRLENNTDQPLLNVRRVIAVRLAGLTGDGVHITRGSFELQKSATGPGEIIFSEAGDSLEPNGRAQTRNYQLTFTASAPAGRAQVTAYALAGGSQKQLGSDSDGVEVKGANGPTKNPEHTPTQTPSPAATVPPPTNTGPPVTIEPLDANGIAGSPNSGGGVPVILYILGGVLVAIGGAILWLLFRSPRPALVDDGYAPGYEPVRPPSLGYPAPGYPPAGPRPAGPPTAVLPVVPEGRTLPPGVDPWAQGGRPGPHGPR